MLKHKEPTKVIVHLVNTLFFFEGIEDVCGCFFSFESKSMTGLNTTAGTLKL